MTTIAYKDGIIATDGQMTAGDVIISLEVEKRHYHDGVYFFLCGSEPDIDELVAAWPDGKMSKSARAAGFVVNQGTLFAATQEDGRCVTWEHPRSAAFAYGSGCEFAIGAMDAGASPGDAIRHASNRDTGTGGTVRCYCATTGQEL